MSSSKQCAVATGTTATPSVYVYLSAAYAGSAVRLMVRRNDQAGITTDTQLASTSTEGEWVQLTGATEAVDDDCVLEFYVDCDGTTERSAWMIGRWLRWAAVDPEGGQKYWFEGLTWAGLKNGSLDQGEQKYWFEGLTRVALFSRRGRNDNRPRARCFRPVRY